MTQGCRRAQLKDVLPDALAQKVPAGVAFVEQPRVVDIHPPEPFRAVQVVQRDGAAAHMGRLEWVREAAEAGGPCPTLGTLTALALQRGAAGGSGGPLCERWRDLKLKGCS